MSEAIPFMSQFSSIWWLAFTAVGFVFFWPLGLAILAYGFWRHRDGGLANRKFWDDFVNRSAMAGFFKQTMFRTQSSGNVAFDEYRKEALRRLDEELKSFHEFRGRLRDAKDRAEFDQFMAEMRARSA